MTLPKRIYGSYHSRCRKNQVVCLVVQPDSSLQEDDGHGCRMIYAGVPSCFGLGLEDVKFQLSGFYCKKVYGQDHPVLVFWRILRSDRCYGRSCEATKRAE